jgi:hypothetical protein
MQKSDCNLFPYYTADVRNASTKIHQYSLSNFRVESAKKKKKKKNTFAIMRSFVESMKISFQCCPGGVAVGGEGPATRRSEGEPRHPLDSPETYPGE